MPANACQHLPTREQNLFRKIGRCYENKQYKKGLMFAKEILRNCPDHGETLAMKGLILASLGRKSEAQDSILAGLRKNIQSYVCWQVYGYFQRLQGNYHDAVKAYRNALRWDKDNLTILRDLSVLEIHIRDFEGFKETRHKILMLKPSQRMSWIGYAVACHLVKDYELASNALHEYLKIEQSGIPAPELSQLLLYENLVLREAGRYSEALDHIQRNKGSLTDVGACIQVQGDILVALGKYDKASEMYYKLIERNTENREYTEKYLGCITSDNVNAIEKIKELCKTFPRSLMMKRLLLERLQGEEYVSLLKEIMEYYLNKGCPALFKLVSSNNLEKRAALESIALSLEESFTKGRNPTALMWTWYLLADHYNECGNTEAALKYIDMVLRHTPTLPEAYLLRAKILKNCGSYNAATSWAIESQSMDKADKYLNSVCARFLLRDNRIEEAEELVTKFTRGSLDTFDYLNEMQCLWYLLDCARAHFRLGQYGESLKKCHDIECHYLKFVENEYDFHSYCLRKMTLCSYVETLRVNDHIRDHRYYRTAAQLAAKIYTHLYDQQCVGKATTSQEKDLKKDGPSKGAKRAAKKKGDNEDNLDKNPENGKKKNGPDKRRTNYDRDGSLTETKTGCPSSPEELLETKDPLGEALKLLRPLICSSKEDFVSHALAFNIYIRQGKLFLAGRSLLKMKEAKPASYRVRCDALRLQKALNTSDTEIPFVNVLKDLMKKEFGLVNNPVDNIHQLATEYMKSASTVDEAFEASRLMQEINEPDAANQFCAKIQGLKLKQDDLQICEGLYSDILHDKVFERQWIDRIRSLFHDRYLLCDSFNAEEDINRGHFEDLEENLLITTILS